MKKGISYISNESFAAFLDGNASAEESQDILEALSEDDGLRELLRISQSVDMEMGMQLQECEFIPMSAMAASCGEDAYCCLECEKYILDSFNFGYDSNQLLADAIQNGWCKENGTALHNVGRHLEKAGFIVTRTYHSAIKEIERALEEGEKVIVAVDGGELIGNRMEEKREDLLVGQIPDHLVVVLSVDAVNNEISIYDPDSGNAEDTYPIKTFENAWNDSKNYLVTITDKCLKPYDPKPIDLSDVELSEDLNDLREAIAENAHDVWAVERKAQGWTYGPRRDDAKKETPCMVPYSQLPDSDKRFDRDMAMNTLKLVKKLGYDFVKREETYFCRKCGNPIYKHQIFCDRCGFELKMGWK